MVFLLMWEWRDRPYGTIRLILPAQLWIIRHPGRLKTLRGQE